jgi:hypothetical protein
MKFYAKRRMLIFFLSIFYLSTQPFGCTTSGSYAEKLVSISGKVVAETTNAYVDTLTIGILQPPPLATDSVASTDSLGSFSFTVESQRRQDIKFSIKGETYSDTTEAFEITPGEDLEDVVLHLTVDEGSKDESDGDSSDDDSEDDDSNDSSDSDDGDSGTDSDAPLKSIYTLMNIPSSDLADGDNVEVSHFYESAEGGGGTFIWDANESKSNHNGGTIIDPAHSAEPGTSRWYSDENTGRGCWKRAQTNAIDVTDFGVRGDNKTDNTGAVRKIFSLDVQNIYFPAGVYLLESVRVDKFKNITGQEGQTVIKKLKSGRSLLSFKKSSSKIGFTLKGVTVDMNHTSKQAITIRNPKNVTVDNSTFINSSGAWFLQNIIQDMNGGAYGDANISITNSRFENNNDIGSVNISTYDSHLTYGIKNIHVENNTFTNVGGSVLSIRAIVPGHKRSSIDDTFDGVTVKNNTFKDLSGGTERFGAIPIEFWGLSDFTISCNSIDTGSLGIGVLNSKDGIIENNAISNQTIASFEVSGRDLTFRNNNITDSHSFISATDDTDSITVKNNMVNGSPRINMEDADMISFRANGKKHKNWLIENNTFSNYYGGRSYMMIGWGFDVVKNFKIRGNSYISETSDSPIRAIYVEYGQNITIQNNEIIYKANIPANSGEKPFIGANLSTKDRAADLTIKGNLVDFRGSVGSSTYIVGIGSQGWKKGTLPNWVIKDNTIKGDFQNRHSYAFKVKETSGNARVFNNDVTEVEGNLYKLHPSVHSDEAGK